MSGDKRHMDGVLLWVNWKMAESWGSSVALRKHAMATMTSHMLSLFPHEGYTHMYNPCLNGIDILTRRYPYICFLFCSSFGWDAEKKAFTACHHINNFPVTTQERWTCLLRLSGWAIKNGYYSSPSWTDHPSLAQYDWSLEHYRLKNKDYKFKWFFCCVVNQYCSLYKMHCNIGMKPFSC